MLRHSASHEGSNLHFDMPQFFVNVQHIDKTNELLCSKVAVTARGYNEASW